MGSLYTNRKILLLIGLGLVFFASKLWLLDKVGTSMPMWDEIDGVGENLFRPWFEGWIRLGHFFHPHNEHRVALTRAYLLGLVVLNQQWDGFVETVGNAIIHSGFALLLLAFGRQRLHGLWFALFVLLVGSLWILPVAWENTLYGFQSQFYFLTWLGFAQLWLVLGSDRTGGRWVLGQLCGLLALGAMASGMVSSLAVIVVVTFEAIRARRWSPHVIATLAVSVVWVTIGILNRYHVVGHEPLQAHSVGDFAQAVAAILSWPVQDAMPFSILMALPLAIALGQLLLAAKRTAFDRVYLGAAVWALSLISATALMRANGYPLSSRYIDMFSILLVLEGIAIGVYLHGRWRWVTFVLWTVAFGIGVGVQTDRMWRSFLNPERARLARAESNVQAYLATGDSAHLLGKPLRDIPYPSGEVLAERFKHPSIQKLLPAVVRQAMSIAPAADAIERAKRLPEIDYPVIAASPVGSQSQPWTWRSERQSADTLPILRFRFCGNLGDPEAALSFAVVSDTDRVVVQPDGPAPNRWKVINVIRPKGEWWIELTDRDELTSIALTAPIEMGWLSWAAEKTIKHHWWVFGAGATLSLIGALLHLPDRRRQPTLKDDDACRAD